MKYEDIVPGIFLRRLNRFVAEVSIDGEVQRAHVRNTGRCNCVLHAGLEVSLQRSRDPGRSTPYTLIAVDSADYGWVNLDSRTGIHLHQAGIPLRSEPDRLLRRTRRRALAGGGQGLHPDAGRRREIPGRTHGSRCKAPPGTFRSHLGRIPPDDRIRDHAEERGGGGAEFRYRPTVRRGVQPSHCGRRGDSVHSLRLYR